MKYRELLDEYRSLLERDVALRMELHQIPKGYLVTKKISGKDYLYLQYTVQGKKKSEYVRDEDAVRIRAAVARRDLVKEEMDSICRELARLENAAKILDVNLYRTFFFLKQCSEMDALPIEKRHGALSFARAMTALEGLPASEDTQRNLMLWMNGEKHFADFYMNALQRYRVLEVM